MEAHKTNEPSYSLPPCSSGKENEKEQISGKHETALPISEELNEEMYEPVECLLGNSQTDKHGYLLPRAGQEIKTQDEQRLPNNNEALQPSNSISVTDRIAEINKKVNDTSTANRSGIVSIYQDLWSFPPNGPLKTQEDANKNTYRALLHSNPVEDEPIYDEVDTVITTEYTCTTSGAKVIPIEEPPSAYDEVIINEGRYVIPSTKWDSDSDAWESDFDDDMVAPSYFGESLERLYENVETRKVSSPTRIMSFTGETSENNMKPAKTVALKQSLRGCLPIPFGKSSKSYTEESPLYVDPNNIKPSHPIMPAASQALSMEEAARHEIVNKILSSEVLYIVYLNQLVQMEEGLREGGLLEIEQLDVIFCSIQDILQCHKMFNMVLTDRMNEWTVNDKLGDIICASFSKSTTMVAYIDFVNNFPTAIDTYRAACKNNTVFAQFLEAKEKSSQPNLTFHDLMLKPFERFPKFILLIQDLLEVTPVGHLDRVPLQLSLTQLECLAENINLRLKEIDMKNQVKYLDSQISQLNKPLSSSGRVFIRQDDMIHCLIDGVSIINTKKLRLVLLSDMLLCLSPISKKKNIVSGFLNTPKYKYKLKWNVPLLDVQFVEYGTGVTVAAGKYGTTTTYSDKGKYRQATVEVQNHIEDLQHDLAVIGQIAGLAASLRGKHELMDQEKVVKWYKAVEKTINEEVKAVNMFWLEISLPTRSGQQNYVFKLSSPTAKEEWECATKWAKLTLETRNNPGWYLPDDDTTNSVSILRQNMPLLAELFDLFIFNTKSTVEHTITYPMEVPRSTTDMETMATKGLGHFVWISARGDLQGHVTVLEIDRNSTLPRFVESFNVCPGTVYSMARIPAMNSRSDQTRDKYHTKYGFPFPTVWLGSHSCRICIHDTRSDDRSRPLMELKLRDAPLAMKYTNKKIYVGLANGTLAIFRSNSSEHWNLVQPSILPLGRFPVAVIADVKDELWCGSGSQIYVVSKKGNRIKRIIAVDSNMKNLVKQIVCCGVGVWVSVWRKSSIKLYHAETCEMLQEINVARPVMKMKNDVDSQVQYLSLDKISVTALVVIPGFLWVGTSCGLILVYPLPKLQGVPRVIGRACIAFHAHCGPVRSLFAVPEGVTSLDETCFVSGVADANAKEIERKLSSALADSDESVGSDEDFSFLDDQKSEVKSSPNNKKSAGFSVGKFKVTLKKPLRSPRSKRTRSGPVVDIPDVEQMKVNDFAVMMETFPGFSKDEKGRKNVENETKVKFFKNRLFAATHLAESGESGSELAEASSPGNAELSVTNILSGRDIPSDKDTTSGKDTSSGKVTASGKDASSEENTSLEQQILPENSVLEESPNMEKPTESNSVLSEKDTVSNEEVKVPEAQAVQVLEEGRTLASNENPSITHNEEPSIVKDSDVQNNETKSTDEQVPSDAGVQIPSGGKSPDSSDHSSDTEPTYVNVPRMLKSKVVDSSPENVFQGNASGKTEPRDDNSAVGILSSELSVDQQDATTPALPDENPQENYSVVLPAKERSLEGINPEASEEQQETGVSQSAKSTSQRGMSYLVMSAGEGHMDLRMKLKSKNDIKKDQQTMLLIWRVNSKA